MTPREVAINLIKGYVERGDSIESLKSGQMGVGCSEYSAGIGGYINTNLGGEWTPKKLRPDQIHVDRVNGVEVCEVFSLKEIYDSIKTKRPLQAQLF